MSQPIPIRLGDDASSIPRKKGLSPEYFYLLESVSVKKLSSCSRRYVGEVLSLIGDLSANNGVMIVGIGSEAIHILFTHVPFYISKLIGNYCNFGADVIRAEVDTGSQVTRLSRIVEDQKIELENLHREKKDEATANAKEVSSLRLQVKELETQQGIVQV